MSIASDTQRVHRDYPGARLVKDDSAVMRLYPWWVETAEGRGIGSGSTPGKAWANARKRVTSGRAKLAEGDR